MLHFIKSILAFLRRLFGGNTSPVPRVDLIPTPPTPRAKDGNPPTYFKRDSLMTYQERHFYFDVLFRVVDSQYRIFSKVRLGDLVGLAEESTDPRYRTETWYKHIDFVLCDRNSLEPLLAIELDDSSHHQYDSRERDAVKDRVCADAELPLLRIKAQYDYPLDEIGNEIRVLIREARSITGSTNCRRLSTECVPHATPIPSYRKIDRLTVLPHLSA